MNGDIDLEYLLPMKQSRGIIRGYRVVSVVTSNYLDIERSIMDFIAIDLCLI